MANFYPRSPCGERLVVDGHRVHITRFLSTLSLRRATIILRYSVSLSVFSIHALLAESDELVWCSSGGAFAFLSTLSLRRATGASHASSQSRRHFYPRSPCGERRYPSGDCRLRAAYFYPRSPCGERPWCISRSTPVQADFYPRSPCGERQEHINRRTDNRNFYPRSPCGERQSSGWGIPNWESISIHALLAESDLPTASAWTLGGVFLSTLSLRRATPP